jgi:two-component system, OmpR family, sensor kinase
MRKSTRKYLFLVTSSVAYVLAALLWLVSPLSDAVLATALLCTVLGIGWYCFRLARQMRRLQGTVTELAEQHERDRLARQEAEEAVRLRDEFLSVASHELRSPITSLRGYVQLLPRQIERDAPLDPQRLLRALRVIDSQSDKLTKLIAQLLDASRAELGKLEIDLESIDLGALVRTVTETFEDTARRSVRLTVPSHPVLIRGDALRLEQVLVNLLNNAAKFDQTCLPIEVTVEQGSATEARLAVRDHGVGVAADEREIIFERYGRAREGAFTDGMGLGLYICRVLTEKHGGSIVIESPVAGGTRFVVTLPVDLPSMSVTSHSSPRIRRAARWTNTVHSAAIK